MEKGIDVFELIGSRLSRAEASGCLAGERVPAAVAMILRRSSEGFELFFIRRAHHPNDPWSGNIGFPGGRYESHDPTLRHTAERETMEEVGIDLRAARYLGRLADIVGQNLPVRVSCFVYCIDGEVDTALSHEVHTAFWVAFERLTDPQRQITAKVRFEKQVLEVPAIDLPVENMPVLWGITYRLVYQLIHLVSEGETGSPPYELPV